MFMSAPQCVRFRVLISLFMIISAICPAHAVQEEWNHRWHLQGQDSVGYRVGLDTAGNIYVGAQTAMYPSWSQSVRLIKYAPDGTEIWNRPYNYIGLDDMKVTDSGEIYVVGIDEANTAFERLLKFDTNGNRVWGRQYVSNGIPNSQALAVDHAGNVFVASTTSVTTIFNPMLVAKYAPDGGLLWKQHFGTKKPNASLAIALDSAGNVYVTGVVYVSHVSTNIILGCATLKYDPNGTLLWSRVFTTPSVDNTAGNGIAVDSAGNVYVAGTQSTIKYDTDGNLVWTYPHHGDAIAVDSQQNVFVLQHYYGHITRLDASGALTWIHKFTLANSMAVGADGSVYVTGAASQLAPFAPDPMQTVKYGADGTVQWVETFAGPVTNGGAYGTNIVLDPWNDVIVVGSNYQFANGGAFNYDVRTIKYSQAASGRWDQTRSWPAR